MYPNISNSFTNLIANDKTISQFHYFRNRVEIQQIERTNASAMLRVISRRLIASRRSMDHGAFKFRAVMEK